MTEFSDRTTTAYFKRSCDALIKNGWSFYPQTPDTREPEHILGRPIKPFSEYNLDDHPPTASNLALWNRHVPSANVAGVMGRGSHYAMAVDIDITDQTLAHNVLEIAESILGKTPLMRIGQEPKIALLYKNIGGAIQNISPKSESGKHGIDILAKMKALTFFGVHHKTGRGFRWVGRESPLSMHASDLPECTPEMIRAFIGEVGLIMPFAQSASGIDSKFTPDWHENAEGKIDDGREKFLFDLVVRVVSDAHNGGIDLRNPQEISKIMADIYQEFASHAIMDGRWVGQNLAHEISSRVNRQCARMLSGQYTPMGRQTFVRRPQATQIEQEFNPSNFVGTADNNRLGSNDSVASDELKSSLTDVPLRMAQEKMANTIQAFLDQATNFIGIGQSAKSAIKDFHQDSKIRIIKAPPGMGKTSAVLRMIAEDPNTYLDGVDINGNRTRAPYIMLVPTYRNIDELRGRAAMFGLDARASDFDLERAAKSLGLIPENAAQDVITQTIDDIRNYSGPGQIYGGLKVEMYQGRVRAGCAMSEQMSLAMKMGAGGSSLCKAQVYDKEAQQRVEKICTHFAGCPAIQQRSIFDRAHLVLMPHAFAGLTIPNEAKNTRGVIIDERIFDLFVHTAFFDLDVLKLARRAPRPSKKEREIDGFDHQIWQDGLNALRREASGIVNRAIKEKRDIAEIFMDLPTGEAAPMLSACKRLCAASMQRANMLEPNMAIEDVQKIASAPTGYYAREEWRFWTLIAERIPTIVNMSLAGDEIKRDERIQILFREEDGTRKIRISWRSTPNWADKPLLLIDASAAPEIIAKVWGSSVDQIDVIDLVQEAKMYDRISTVLIAPGAVRENFMPKSLSNYSILGPANSSLARLNSASLLTKIRNTISAIAMRHSDGRVLVGATIAARRAITQSWGCPHNVDFCHFGALRGIDAFKHHVAALSIGRLEIPPDALDGLAAALTYDDENPDQPMNHTGTGYYEGNPIRMPIQQKTLKFRKNGVCEVSYPAHTGRWGRLVQAQYREEELVQFLGRLRPFYRTGEKPVWYCMSNIVSDGAIIDDTLTTGSIVSQVDFEIAETNRRAQGVLTPESITNADPYAPKATAKRCVARAAAIGEPFWRAVNDGGNNAGYIASSTAISATTPDKLDMSIGTNKSRIARENRLIRYVARENYARGWVAEGKFEFSDRIRKVTPRQWRQISVKEGGVTKLDFYELVALASLNLLHSGEAEKLDPFKAVDIETREFAHYGEWTSISDI